MVKLKTGAMTELLALTRPTKLTATMKKPGGGPTILRQRLNTPDTRGKDFHNIRKEKGLLFFLLFMSDCQNACKSECTRSFEKNILELLNIYKIWIEFSAR